MLKNIKAAIFDLDGTLLDSLADIAKTTNTALQSKGFPTKPVEDFRYFVGEGIYNMLLRSAPAGTDEQTLQELVNIAKDEYSKHWARETKIYSGIEQMLVELQKRNIKLAVLSNKLEGFTKTVVQHFFPHTPFLEVLGSTKEKNAKPDPTKALVIASSLGVMPEQVMFMGDTKTDMQTANNAGMVAIGVLWGFRQKQELQDNMAKLIIEKPMQILDYL